MDNDYTGSDMYSSSGGMNPSLVFSVPSCILSLVVSNDATRSDALYGPFGIIKRSGYTPCYSCFHAYLRIPLRRGRTFVLFILNGL